LVLKTNSKGIDVLFKLYEKYSRLRMSSNGTNYAMELQKLFQSEFAVAVKEAGLLSSGTSRSS